MELKPENMDGIALTQAPGSGNVEESLHLEESELSSLTLGSDDQLNTADLETLANIEDELERFHAEALGSDEDTHSLVAHEVTVIAEETVEHHLSILPHMEEEESQEGMLSEVLSEQEVLTTISEDNNLEYLQEPMNVECETVLSSVVEASSSSSSSFVVDSIKEEIVTEGSIIEEQVRREPIKIESSVPVSLMAQTIASASSEGTIIHSAPLTLNTNAMTPVPIRVKSYSGPSAKSVAITGVRNIKPVNSISVANNSNLPKNVILSKVVLAGGNVQTGLEGLSSQTIRVINTGQKKLVPSPTKAITLAQARQMGLLSPGKLQQILPNPNIKKVVVSPSAKNTVTIVKQPTRIAPARIAPAPVQFQTITPAATVGSGPQKVLIRHGSTFKPGTILTTNSPGQVIRIPASQNLSAGNIHQIQLPPGSKQVQYVRLVSASSTPPTVVTTSASGKTFLSVTSVTKPVPVALSANQHAFKMNTERVLIPAPSSVTQIKSEANSTNTAVVQGTPLNNIVMLPAQYLTQGSAPVVARSQSPVVTTSSPTIVTATVASSKEESSPPTVTTTATATTTTTVTTATTTTVLTTTTSVTTITTAVTSTVSSITNSNTPVMSLQTTQHKRTISVAAALEPNGIRPRKPCNCTKSQCLKLYCDCFANGEFCYLCNCVSCYNNLEHEEDRQRAIKSCLERNPNAFRPKIGKSYVGDGERRHNKGCNCKRSGCLKNYCECYEAKIPCSNNCKCVGCQNEDDGRGFRELVLAAEEKVSQQAVKNRLSAEIQGIAFKPENQGPRQPFTLMTQEVVEATCQCLLAQTEDVARVEQAQRLILEEFGRCLVQIIDCASKAPQPPT